jgi:hypothetical protein
MNTETVQLPKPKGLPRLHRQIITVTVFSFIVALTLSLTDIHRHVARVIFNVLAAVYDRVSQ